MTRVGPQGHGGGGGWEVDFTVIFQFYYEHNHLLQEDIDTIT